MRRGVGSARLRFAASTSRVEAVPGVRFDPPPDSRFAESESKGQRKFDFIFLLRSCTVRSKVVRAPSIGGGTRGPFTARPPASGLTAR